MAAPISARGRTVLPAELTEQLRPYLQAAADEMAREIRGMVPECASILERKYGQTIAQTIGHFIESLVRPDEGLADLIQVYAGIGADEAQHGRNLDGLQTAIRVSGQVACRRFIKDAFRLGWERETLELLTESMFVYLERLARAASEGYVKAQEQLTGVRERNRGRLRDLLVAHPPASREAIIDLARMAGWNPPQTIGLLALPPGAEISVLPPGVLADWSGEAPFLVIPDPDGPGQERLVAAVVRYGPAAIGPTVPLTEGAGSLRWARQALALIERGVLPDDGVVHCTDHLATLMVSASEDLVAVAMGRLLAPLLALPAHRRELLARTLLAYLQCGDNAVLAADLLHIHQQTVRYRIHRLEEMYVGEITDPQHRLELMIALHALLSPAHPETGEGLTVRRAVGRRTAAR
jgi:PucR C-terminal helix-turn-helix domain